MSWPTYDNKHDWPAAEVYAEIFKAVLPTTYVDLIIADEPSKQDAISLMQNHGISDQLITSKMRFHIMDYADIWLRDTGPVFVKAGDSTIAVDFKFDGWGWGLSFIKDQAYKEGIILDEGLDRRIAQSQNIPYITSPLIMEGGALEFNGNGTLLVSEDVVFQRNPLWTKVAVEAEFRRLFGTKKVIWLKGYLGNDAHPVLNAPFKVQFGDGLQDVYTLLTTNGHTDEFIRFINENTVLLAEAPPADEAAHNPIAAKSRETILKTRQILQSSSTESGKPFVVIDFPEVKPLYVNLDSNDDMYKLMTTLNFDAVGKQDIDENVPMKGVLAASYLNYFIINDVILLAKYAGYDASMATADEEAKQKLQQAFPGKTIVQIDAKAINVGGGGIHCITKQMPKLRN
ncbi:MAG: agmatine deiminase family protein [Chitinophagaceae bacterium]|nr:agmatine deiminase family protein [Chitinophagaceae bacterium]